MDRLMNWTGSAGRKQAGLRGVFMTGMKVLAILMLVLVVAGCTRSSPYERTVNAKSQMELALWRSKVGRELSPREWRLFDRALEELRLQVMIEKKASGSEAIGKVVFAQIDGQRLQDVMNTGLSRRLARIAAEKEEFDELYHRVERVRTLPGDDESADYIASVRRTHAERKSRLEADLAEAKQDLADLKQFGRQALGEGS